MFDLGMSELLVIGIVALIVIGPKDLPGMFATLGRFTAKARAMSREFSRAMEAAAKESGVSEVAKDLKTVTSTRSLGLDAVKDAASKFEKWDPLKPQTSVPTASPTVSPTTPSGPATQALAAAQSEKRILAKEKADLLRAQSNAPKGGDVAPAVSADAGAPRVRGGRVRSKPEAEPPVPQPASAKRPSAKAAVANPPAKPATGRTAKPRSPKADA